MAITFAVRERREGRKFGQRGRGDQIDITWNREFYVDVTATGGDAVTDANDYEVATATGLPLVNKSIYEVDGKIIPFVVCRAVTLDRDAGRLDRWIAKASYTSQVQSGNALADNQPITPPVAVTDITPRETGSFGEIERVLYTDYSAVPKPVLTPLKHFYAEPLLEPISTLIVKITQHEATTSYATLRGRRKRCNDDTYRTDAAYTWLIQEVEFQDVTVTLSGGATDCSLVTYTLEYNPMTNGWEDERVLIDTHYLDGGVRKAFADDELRTEDYGFITSAGAKKAGSTPDYEQFRRFQDIDFDSFLRV
jgi:hypothetical protein